MTSITETEDSTLIVIVLRAILSLLVMLSFAFWPWIVPAFVSNKVTFGSSRHEEYEEASAPKEPLEEIHGEVEDVSDVSGVASNRATASALSRPEFRPILPEQDVLEGGEDEERSTSPVPTTSNSSPAMIVTPPIPKRSGLVAPTPIVATSVAFEPSASVVQPPKMRPSKRKVSCEDPSVQDRTTSKTGLLTIVDMPPKKKQLKSPTSSTLDKTLRPSSKSPKQEHLMARIQRRQTSTKNTAKKWMTMYEKLVAFRDAHNGSVMIPWSETDADLQQLGYWVRDQQRKLRTNKLSRHRVDLLQSVGLALDARRAKKYL